MNEGMAMSRRRRDARDRGQVTASLPAEDAKERSRAPRWPAASSTLKRLGLSLLGVLVFVGGVEGLLRLTKFDYAPRQKRMYKPWVGMFDGTVEEQYNTIWDPPGYIWVFPPEAIQANDFLKWPSRKDPAKKRVAFLGGSTTQPHRYFAYPRRAIKLLNEVAGSNAYEELNLGMSSYSTHQCLIALQRYGLPRDPDCVVVYEGWNDSGVWGDGYSSKEKDALIRVTGVPSEGADRVRNLRLARLVGWVADALDFTWPRANVSPADHRKNLHAMANLCAARNTPLVIVKKPVSLSGPKIEKEWAPDNIELRYWRKFGATNCLSAYRAKHKVYSGIQEEVARDNRNARLADAERHLLEAQDELKAAPHEGVRVFMDDGGHVTALGNQKIAEVVATGIAPELADKIRDYIQSAVYWKNLALEFKTMDSPFECDYAAGKAVAKDPSLVAELEPLRDWARSQYQFWRLFEANRWLGYMRGTLPDYLPNMLTCLKMRPHDFGVAQQIHRLCLYHGQLQAALPGLLGFQPDTQEYRYRWLHMMLDAAIAGQNADEAEKVSREILKMNPQDQRAAQVQAAVQRQKLQQRR